MTFLGKFYILYKNIQKHYYTIVKECEHVYEWQSVNSISTKQHRTSI